MSQDAARRAGKEWPTFLFSYEYEGSNWSFQIKAQSIGDARARLAKLALARYDGVLDEIIPWEKV